MYLTLVFLPLLSALSAGFFGYALGEKGSSILTTTLIGLTTLMSYLAFYEVGLCGATIHIHLSTWIDCELFTAKWGFYYDALTVTMLGVVTTVSTLVHLYSTEYMRGDPHLPRFMAYLSLFTFFMLILVTADNYLQMFVGWEGVGLCSYLLINFWFTRIQANKAAIQAMLVNRVGDVGLILGIMVIFSELKTVDYTTVFALAPQLINKQFIFFNCTFNCLSLISFLLFIGAVGKSAQLGLHTWLPNAMEGPTPVSALIHAATMVTAGVFLLARSSPLIEYAPFTLQFITVIGALTAFFAATTGLLQNDLKKVIAYSTCSQLGYMVFACGLSAYSVGVFHLANHAFFKALLFLSAGSVIHAMADEQDMRRMGGLVRILPFTYAMIFIGSLALMGFPFLSGFYSKDVILEVAFATYTIPGHLAYYLGTFGAFFTAFYSIRLLHLTFISNPTGFKKSFEGAHEGTWKLTLPLLILSIGSIFFGYIMRDMFIGLGTDFWSTALFTHPKSLPLIDAEFIPHSIKLTPVIFSIVGGSLAFICYSLFNYSLFNLKTNSLLGRSLYTFINRRWFFDKVYTEFIVQEVLRQCYHTTYKTVDRGLIEMFGPFGISNALYNQAYNLSRFHSGHLYHYTLTMLLAVCIPLTLILCTKLEIFSLSLPLTALFFFTTIFVQNSKE